MQKLLGSKGAAGDGSGPANPLVQFAERGLQSSGVSSVFYQHTNGAGVLEPQPVQQGASTF